MKTVILGAGASRGSFSGDFVVPTSREFGGVLQAIDSCWRSRYPDVLKVVEHLGLDATDWALEPVWTCVDLYAKLAPTLPQFRPWNDENPQLKKALLSVYGQRCDNAVARVSDESTLAKVLATLEPQDCLVSFNYDTIAERIAMRRSISISRGQWAVRESCWPNLTDLPLGHWTFAPETSLLKHLMGGRC